VIVRVLDQGVPTIVVHRPVGCAQNELVEITVPEAATTIAAARKVELADQTPRRIGLIAERVARKPGTSGPGIRLIAAVFETTRIARLVTFVADRETYRIALEVAAERVTDTPDLGLCAKGPVIERRQVDTEGMGQAFGAGAVRKPVLTEYARCFADAIIGTAHPGTVTSAPRVFRILSFDHVVEIGIAAVADTVLAAEQPARATVSARGFGLHPQSVGDLHAATRPHAIVVVTFARAFGRSLHVAIDSPVVGAPLFALREVVDTTDDIGPAPLLCQRRAGNQTRSSIAPLVLAHARRQRPLIGQLMPPAGLDIVAILNVPVTHIGLQGYAVTFGHIDLGTRTTLSHSLAGNRDLARRGEACFTILPVCRYGTARRVGHFCQIDRRFDALCVRVGTAGCALCEAIAAIDRRDQRIGCAGGTRKLGTYRGSWCDPNEDIGPLQGLTRIVLALTEGGQAESQVVVRPVAGPHAGRKAVDLFHPRHILVTHHQVQGVARDRRRIDDAGTAGGRGQRRAQDDPPLQIVDVVVEARSEHPALYDETGIPIAHFDPHPLGALGNVLMAKVVERTARTTKLFARRQGTWISGKRFGNSATFAERG